MKYIVTYSYDTSGKRADFYYAQVVGNGVVKTEKYIASVEGGQQECLAVANALVQLSLDYGKIFGGDAT